MDARQSSVKGSVDVFYLLMKSQHPLSWRKETVVNKRISLSDKSLLCSSAEIVAVVCNNLDSNRSKSRGHAAMIYEADGNWHLVFIWTLTRDKLMCYLVKGVEQDQLEMIEKVVDMQLGNVILKFVSLFGVKDSRIQDPAFINQVDGGLNIGTRPTWIPVPSWSTHIKNDPPAKSSEKRCRRKRGGKRSQSRHVPGHVSKHIRLTRTMEFLNIFLEISNLEQCSLSLLERRVRLIEKNSYIKPMDKRIYLLPKDLCEEENEHERVDFEKKTFYLVSKRMIVGLNGKTKDEYEKLLCMCETVDLISLPYSRRPVRMFLCVEAEYESQRGKDNTKECSFEGIGQFIYNVSSEIGAHLPGTLFSTWDFNEGIADTFDQKDLLDIQDRFGSFFGNRSSVSSGGINGYIGPRLSSRPTMTPALGPGTVFNASYYRQHYNQDHKHPELRSKISLAAKKVQQVAHQYAGSLMQFIGYDACSRLIWTQGSSLRTTQAIENQTVVTKTQQVDSMSPIGFFNTPHRDKCDTISEKHYATWMKQLEEEDKSGISFSEMKRMEERIGIGLPTVCGYNEVKHRTEKIIHAWFADLIFCCRLRNGCVHYFCGWASPHCTCVPVASLDECVSTMNTSIENSAIIAGWGESGRDEHAIQSVKRKRKRKKNAREKK